MKNCRAVSGWTRALAQLGFVFDVRRADVVVAREFEVFPPHVVLGDRRGAVLLAPHVAAERRSLTEQQARGGFVLQRGLGFDCAVQNVAARHVNALRGRPQHAVRFHGQTVELEIAIRTRTHAADLERLRILLEQRAAGRFGTRPPCARKCAAVELRAVIADEARMHRTRIRIALRGLGAPVEHHAGTRVEQRARPRRRRVERDQTDACSRSVAIGVLGAGVGGHSELRQPAGGSAWLVRTTSARRAAASGPGRTSTQRIRARRQRGRQREQLIVLAGARLRTCIGRRCVRMRGRLRARREREHSDPECGTHARTLAAAREAGEAPACADRAAARGRALPGAHRL